VFDNQGKYDDALKWFRRALSGQERALGPDHPSTLTTVHNMTSAKSQRKYGGALGLFRRPIMGALRHL